MIRVYFGPVTVKSHRPSLKILTEHLRVKEIKYEPAWCTLSRAITRLDEGYLFDGEVKRFFEGADNLHIVNGNAVWTKYAVWEAHKSHFLRLR